MQDACLYHPGTDRVVTLGRFFAPPAYVGEFRVDTHPRASRDGSTVIIDFADGGDGRQMVLIDLSEIKK